MVHLEAYERMLVQGWTASRMRSTQQDAERKIQELHQRLKDGKYQAQPLRRVYIPKENGKQRPISIPALEDRSRRRRWWKY